MAVRTLPNAANHVRLGEAATRAWYRVSTLPFIYWRRTGEPDRYCHLLSTRLRVARVPPPSAKELARRSVSA